VQNLFAGHPPTPTELLAAGAELLRDPAFSTIRKKDVHPFTALDWNEPGGAWSGKGEPFETRRIDLTNAEDRNAQRTIRYSGVNQEGLYQTVAVTPGTLYRATVRVRGKISPGNMTYLFVGLADQRGKNLDLGLIDRLPLGDFPEWTTLEMIVRAPPGAALMGFGLRALYQVNDDFVEFTEPSLRAIVP